MSYQKQMYYLIASPKKSTEETISFYNYFVTRIEKLPIISDFIFKLQESLSTENMKTRLGIFCVNALQFIL